ncbi:hypothetical protein JCM12178A_01430 [Salidesulfovibrio brasiliensis]
MARGCRIEMKKGAATWWLHPFFASGGQGAALHPAKGIIPSALPDLKAFATSEHLTCPASSAEGKPKRFGILKPFWKRV